MSRNRKLTNVERPTSNAERRMTEQSSKAFHSTFGVRCSMFGVRIFGFVLFAMTCTAIGADVQSQIDWPKFLSRHDLLYSKVQTKWGEAPFTGKGLLGAMVYTTEGGTGLRLRVTRREILVY